MNNNQLKQDNTTVELKAKELIEKFRNELSGALYSPHNDVSAKQCALICVDEIIKEIPVYPAEQKYEKIEFWQSVKSAIEKH